MSERSKPNWQIILLLAPVGARAAAAQRSACGSARTALSSSIASPWMMTVVVLAHGDRRGHADQDLEQRPIEHRLQEQEKALLGAKIEALKSQINPHFLFNTLTSISSLIRSQPDTARTLIIKLSACSARCCAATNTS
jgi:two-component system LytT family sensor kinase